MTTTPETADLYAQIVESRNRPRPHLDALREAVRAEGGDWTVKRAMTLFLGINWHPSPERLRLMLNLLAEEGLLIKHGARGKLWTPADPPGPPTVEYRIESKVTGTWRFSSTWDDEDTARHRIAGLRTECPGSTWRLTEVTTRILDDGGER